MRLKTHTRWTFLAAFVLLTMVAGLLSGSQPAQALGKDARQQVLRASVKLMTPFDANSKGGSLCSGTMLNQQGFILSNFHCVGYVDDGQRDPQLEQYGLDPGDFYNKQRLSVVAITDDARRLPVPTYIAQVKAWSAELDISVLQIVGYYNSKQSLPATLPVIAMPLADSDAVETLDEVIVVGYPGIAGDTVTATEGKISGFLDQDGDDEFDWFKTDVLVNQGNSGGSAVNENGELIGIPTARLQDQSGNVIYLVRPTNVAVPYIQRAMNGIDTNTPVKPVPNPSQPTPQPGSTTGSINAIVFGTGFNNNSGVTGEAENFPSGVAEVHAGLEYSNMRDGTAWGYTWQYDGEDATGDTDLKWTFGSSGILDLSLRGRQGLSDGAYNLQVFLRGRLVQESGFLVGSTEPPAPEPPDPGSDNGVFISGSVIDQNTGKAIQGAIVVFLYAGMTIDDFDSDDSEGKTDTVLSYGTTDAQGAFLALTPLPRGETYSAIVGARGYRRLAVDGALEITADDPALVELDPIELERQ